MKLLDQYVLRLFAKNYLISLTVLIGMYVVMDMVLRFDTIVKVEKQIGGTGQAGLMLLAQTLMDVGSYYFYRCFVIFVQMSGVIPVVAAAFTLMRLSRFNELTAFLAAGVPMLRMALPIILASCILNVALMVDQELILPAMIPQLLRSHDEMHKSNGDQYPITAMKVDENSVLVCGLYDPHLGTMRDMDIVERNDDLLPTAHLMADLAKWDPANHCWNLTGGKYVKGLLPGERNGAETPMPTYSGTVTPDEIDLYHGSGAVEFLSTYKISELIHRPKSYGRAGLTKILTLRLTQPFMNIILMLLSIPFVMTYDAKTLKTAATKCLLLLGAAMGSVFLCQQIAAQPPLGPQWANLWPALMSCMPIFIFAPVSVFLLLKVRT